MTSSSNTSRIAKNTLLLYFRMLLTMGVTLYTSRVILNALGVEDYGIYNVVGGVVAMFGILSGSLSSAISRFITFELGKGDLDKLKRIFCTSVNIQVILIAIITILMETIGIWFLNNKMVIPEERLVAANWVFQFSVITFALNLLSVPYNAVIIAHEKMSAFAYISIVDVTLKLIVAFIIAYNPFDRLVYYGLLIMIVGVINRMMYAIYSKRHFEEATYRMIFDKELMKEMFGFAGWNFFGAGSALIMKQGVDILLNIFFGVQANAARGIANQVDNAINLFVKNFTTALNPQIIKSYATSQKDFLFSLMFRGAKFSYFLVMIFAIPIICETHFILTLWLKNFPEHTIQFVQLSIIVIMIYVLTNTLITAMLATGNIKKYQLIVGGLGMLVLPIAWCFFYFDYPPEMSYVSNIIIFVAQLIARLFLMREMIQMSIKKYLSEVLLWTMLTTVIAFPIPYILSCVIEESFIRFITVTGVSLGISALTIFFIGLKSEERMFVRNQADNFLKKVIPHKNGN